MSAHTAECSQRSLQEVTPDIRIARARWKSDAVHCQGCGVTFAHRDVVFFMGVWRGELDREGRRQEYVETRCARCVNLLTCGETLSRTFPARVRTEDDDTMIDILRRLISASSSSSCFRRGEHQPEEQARDSERRQQRDDPGGLVDEVLDRPLEKPGHKPCCHSGHKWDDDWRYRCRHLRWFLL
jgi:hypothetical protein